MVVSGGVVRDRGASLLAAVALHGVALLAFFLEPPPQTESPPLPPEVGGISATIVNLSFDGPEGAAATSQPLETLYERLAAATPTAAPGGDRPSTSLDDLFGGVSSPASNAGGAAGANVRAGDPRDQVSIPRARGGGQPCWRRAPQPLAVTMRILVDEQGNLVGRPRIVRSRYPEAEAQAWRAMAGCAPYSALPAGRYRALDLDFSAPPSSWIKAAGDVTAN